jgi:AmmeMemoRadiSam system radical SAM enzyme/AmmeMemoRadiSam system protein B/AmmeMemoRadiSam system protein A
MTRKVVLPPEDGVRPDGLYAGGWWHEADDQGRIVCDLCPRECHLKPGDRGFCFVRQNVDGEMMLTTYGRSTGFCIDPIEKKPLNHFLPGTSVLSFGTAGCNLGCKFCQNWDISKSRKVERLSELASPSAIAAAASHFGCRSVAYTYNDPIIFAEYAIDTARECRAVGVKNVAVTAGYVTPAARGPFFEYLDAANVDLKAFTEEFYYKLTYSHLQPVLDTLAWLKKETDVWFEITNLIIPQANDTADEIRRMCDWILQHVGDDVPTHFTAFHPDFRMKDRPATPHETLLMARETARQQGIKFAYTGNVNDVTHQSTYCPACDGLVIERNWYDLGEYHLQGNHCGHCGHRIAGIFEDRPGDWGRRRLPVDMSQFSRPLPLATVARQERKDAPEPPPSSPIEEEENPMSSQGSPARLRAQRPNLSEEQTRLVHHAACEIVAAAILQRPESFADATLAGAAEKTVMGAFVTLKRNGRLRACCGALGRPMPLGAALRESAVRTATEDNRLPTISPTELAHLDVEVSLLYGFQSLEAKGTQRAEGVEVGRHGLQIQRGNAGGLLLPSVATEHGYDATEFLRQVCRKAGLPSNAWEDENTLLQTFETATTSGDFDSQAIGENPAPPELVSDDELRQMAAHCSGNIGALAQGATPSYYLPGCPDGTVNGIAISLKPEGSDDAVHFFRFSMRPGMPLQSTLYNVTEAAANALRSGQLRLPQGNVQLTVSLLHDPAMHGTVADPDLSGIDPANRAVLVTEGAKSAWAFDPSKSADELLQATSESLRVFNPEAANVFSFAARTTDPSILVTTAPRPLEGPPERAAAVAGTFYPADTAELQRMVEGFIESSKGRPKSWSAVMVPHAGLVYSGQIAASVLRKVKIPETVIILAPKHTRLGMEWAVAPHAQWSIPGATLAGDPELARKLADEIPGLELDAAAHQREHAIEVQLPLLAQYAPETKVVGITIGGGDLDQCRQFAKGLAKVIGEMESPPLLIISSDMNHYAPDAENRRLDEIALESFEKLDPEELYGTVRSHDISMCGVLPAVIVMETLKEMGGLSKCERVAYGTSADTSGDASRVVGYAGMLLS